MRILTEQKKIILGVVAILVVASILVITVVKKSDNMNKSQTGVLDGYLKLLTKQDDNFYYADAAGALTTYTGYTQMNDFYKNTTVVTKSGEYALINKAKKEIISFGTYKRIDNLKSDSDLTDLYKVQNDDKKYGVVNNKGKKLLDCKYEDISLKADGNIIMAKLEDNKYEVYTKDAKLLTEVNSKNVKVRIESKLNSTYDNIIYISDNEMEYFYNQITGTKIYERKIESASVAGINYNVIVKNTGTAIKPVYTITFLNEKGQEIRTENAMSNVSRPTVSAVSDKYIIVNQKLNSIGTNNGKYTVYDSKFKEVFTSERPLDGILSKDGKAYFFQNNKDNVIIYNEKFEQIKAVKDATYTNTYKYDIWPSIIINMGSNKFDEYNFKGEQVNENIKYSIFSSEFLKIDEYSDSKLLKTRLYTLDCKYSIVLNASQKCVNSLVNNNILVMESDKYQVINLNTHKVTFEFNKDDYSSVVDKHVAVIKLNDGYYNFSGKKILDIK